VLPDYSLTRIGNDGRDGPMRYLAILRYLAIFGVLAAIVEWPQSGWAQPPLLTLSFGIETRCFSAAALLARSDVATVEAPHDESYGRSMTYCAVPLLDLLPPDALNGVETIEARATDGFVAQLPAELVARGGHGAAVAWIAVEDPAHKWPDLPGKQNSAGPFYLVWEHPERSGVKSEQWPYALAELHGVEPPAWRWPQMGVEASLPADASARRGQAIFTAQCLPCHRINGAGNGEMGPDLNRPMNPTRYLTPDGLRALIRNPRNVRTWPAQQMIGFDQTALPDADLDALIAYLTHMAARPSHPGG
jgi:mono/diheme cytochrome c family protein